MSHPPRRVRHDAYGVPLPSLELAQRQSRLHSEQNQAMRRYVLWLLEHEYADLYVPGTFAEMTFRLQFDDGTIQDSVRIKIDESHRYRPKG